MREEPPVCFADSPLLRKGAARGAGRRGVGPYDVNTEFGMKAAAPERSGGFLRRGVI